MNYLAHFLLADPELLPWPAVVLAECLKGDLAVLADRKLRAAVLFHRRLDRVVDTHPITVGAKMRFPVESRRYAGILLDLFFDHLLANQFPSFNGHESLASFAGRVHLALQAHQDYPAKGWRIVQHLIADHWLENYVQLQGLQPALDYLSARLGRSNPLPAALDLFPTMQKELAADLHALLPHLRAFAREFGAELSDRTLA